MRCQPLFLALLVLGRASGAGAVYLREVAPAQAPGNSTSAGLAGRRSRSLIVRSAHVDKRLVVCNAYASSSPLDIFRVRAFQRLTSKAPLKYKQCNEFLLSLEEGDQLDFKAGNLDVGTFYASGLPASTKSLLLIPYRRNKATRAVGFESHAFSQLQSPQLAVFDAYRGKESGAVKIIDDQPNADAAQATQRPAAEESLQFNQVVAVNPGKYQIELVDGAGRNVTSVPVLMQGTSEHVVLRVGTDPFPQDLIVFPDNGAARRHYATVSIALAVLALLA